MLEFLDEAALRVLGLAAEEAGRAGRQAVEPQDVVTVLGREYTDLVTAAVGPQGLEVTTPPQHLRRGDGDTAPPAALLADAGTRELLAAAVADSYDRDQPRSVGVPNLLMGALIEARMHPPGETREGLTREAHSLSLSEMRNRIRFFGLETSLRNYFTAMLQRRSARLLPAAVEHARAAGSERVEPPHLLAALQSDGIDMVRRLFAAFRLDLRTLPLRTGPDTAYLRGAPGSRPSFSAEAQRAIEYAERLEDTWTSRAAGQTALLCGLFATWAPATNLLARSGLSQDALENLAWAERQKRTLLDPGAVRAILARNWGDTPLAPLVTGTTVLARRCLLAANNIAHHLREDQLTPFHVGVAALHLGGADPDASLASALAYLRADWQPIADILDRPIDHDVVTDGWFRPLKPPSPATVEMLLGAPAIAARLRRDAVDTCALMIAAAARDDDVLSSLQVRGGVTIDLLASAAATNAAHVRGPDAVVHPPRAATPRRPVLVEPVPESAGDVGNRTSSTPHLRELVFRGEMTTGEFLNSDLQLNRLLRYRIAATAQSGLDVLRLAGTVGAAAAGGWWLLVTFLGHGLRPGRTPTWLLLLEVVPIVLLPPWLGVVIALSLVSRLLEAWWSVQWRRAATGDPGYDLRRMRRDNWHSSAGGLVNLAARRRAVPAT